MGRLLVFNPEHDYALAHNGATYLPPASVRFLAKKMEYLPCLWAQDSDLVLLEDDSLFSIEKGKRIDFKEAAEEIDKVEPWGWDKRIVARLARLGLDSGLLPSFEELENLRRLSHRRISIRCNQFLGSPHVPEEFFDVINAVEFAGNNPGCYFKMPWSSGGRGVVCTRELTLRQTKEWVSGAIRRQGSVMAEKGVDRVIDFATLWNITDGEANFDGVSISLSDGRGKYDGNLTGRQETLMEILRQKAPSFSSEIIERQKDFLNRDMAPHFSGKLGIDMMADKAGVVYPCVELNLRRTMGHVAMDCQKHPEKKYLVPSPLLIPV